MTTLEDRIASTARLLLATAREQGMAISGDSRVGEGDAARLLSMDPDSVRHLRDEGRGPAAYRVSVGGSRWSYRIDDLGAFIEARRG